MPTARQARRVLLLVCGYASLTVWLTWPLVLGLATKLPCTDLSCGFDTVYSAWVLSWLSHAITTMPGQLGDANIYYPSPQALFYGPAGFGALPYFLPTFLLTGNAALALNVMLLLCVTLTAVAVHWVVWRWTGLDTAGFVAAWGLLMNRWYLWGFAAVTSHLAVIQYLPLIVWQAAKPMRTRRAVFGLLALVTLQCLTDPVYTAPAVLGPLGLLALFRVVRRSSRLSGWYLLLVVAVAPFCLLPFLVGYLRVRVSNPGLAEQSVWVLPSAIELNGVVPSDLRNLFWHAGAPTSVALPLLATIVIGILVAAVRRLRRREPAGDSAWAHALLWTGAGTLASLSPIAVWGLHWADGGWQGPILYLPQYVLAVTTPLYEIIRVPVRLGVTAMIGLCLLGGLAFAEIARCAISTRWSRVALAAALAALAYRMPPIGAHPIRAAYPLQNAPPTNPALLEQLRASSGPLLEVPAQAPRQNAAAMYRSTRHWRPLVNGYSSYWPAGFPERIGVAKDLPAAEAVRRLACETDVQTILVNLGGYRPEGRAQWHEVQTTGRRDLTLIGTYPMQLLFAVTVPQADRPGGRRCPRVTPAAPARVRAAPGSGHSGAAPS